MAFGNNIKGKQKKAYFQQAGGAIITFKHPFLAGQIDANNTMVDEIDLSSCLKLDGEFFNATPDMDSCKKVVMIDGSVITITNNLMAGELTLPLVPTSGLVSRGDGIEAFNLIRSVGDSIGGVLGVTRRVGDIALTDVYYGVTVKSMPHRVLAGNDVPVYNTVLSYAGWFQASNAADVNQLKIWAVGGEKGLEAHFLQFGVNNGSTGSNPPAVDNLEGMPTTFQDDGNVSNPVADTDDYGFVENQHPITDRLG